MLRSPSSKLFAVLPLLLAAATAAALDGVGSTRLWLTGVGELPKRAAFIESGQTVSVTTRTWPVAAGQSVAAVVSHDGWQTSHEVPLQWDFNAGGQTQWFAVLGPYPKGRAVDFYIRAAGSGQTRFDANGGENFGFFCRRSPEFRRGAILQWFETDYRTLQRRLPEVVRAGYEALYLPPPQKSGGGTFSVGYNPFDRFDLGDRLQSGSLRTRYGTTQELIELVRAAKRLGLEVYCDLVFNHNDNRAGTAIDRYPNLIPEDFHIFSSANPNNQEVNFNGAGPFTFTTLHHDLMGLADIAHENGNLAQTGAFTLPAYAGFNPQGKPAFVRQPLNPHYYPGAAAYAEDVRQFLLRWGWYLTELVGFDGFRLDAVRHTPAAFFGRAPDQPAPIDVGYHLLDTLYALRPNLYVFGEDYSGSGWELREYAKTGMNLLDFPLKWTMDGLFNSSGFASLAQLANGYGLDAETGLPFEQGGLAGHVGVAFVQSHDDGPPASNNLAHAWILTRSGRPKVYYDGNNVQPGNWGHFPRPGRADALGHGSDMLLRLLDARKRFGRGALVPRHTADNLFVFERQVDGAGLLLVGLNNRGDTTPLTATVATAFLPGTQLQDLSGQRPPVTVGAGGSVTLTVPSNHSATQPNNGTGYVLYAPRTPAPAATPVWLHGTVTGKEFTFSSLPLPHGAHASPGAYSAAVVDSELLTVRVETDATGHFAAIKLNRGMPLAGRPMLTGTEEGLTDGYVPMTKLGAGKFVLPGIDLSGFEEGLHVFRVRVFADTGSRPGLYTEIPIFILLRHEARRTIDGDLAGLPAIAYQSHAPTSQSNRLDILHAHNDDRFLYLGLSGTVDPAEHLTNGVAAFIDLDPGLGTGLRDFSLLRDDSGPASRLLSNGRVSGPAGFGAEFGLASLRRYGIGSSGEAPFTGSPALPPVGASAGLFRIDPQVLDWLVPAPAAIAWQPRPGPFDPPKGLEAAIPLETLYGQKVPNQAAIGLLAYLLTTGESGGTLAASNPLRGTLGGRPAPNSWLSNQFLPPQPNVAGNPAHGSVATQAYATYAIQFAQPAPPEMTFQAYPPAPDPTLGLVVQRIVVTNGSASTVGGPLYVRVMPNARAVQLVEGGRRSLVVPGAQYRRLTTSPFAPGESRQFFLQYRSASRTFATSMELLVGEGAL
jgi:hypothetical protein